MKKYFLRGIALYSALLMIGLTSCQSDDTPNDEQTYDSSFANPEGTFILNEQKRDDFSTLTYISPKGEITDSVYWRVNHDYLGSVTQDMTFANGKVYFISQNGDHDGKGGMLIIADARTMRKEKIFKKSEMGDLYWPTHLVVVDGLVYIRDQKGVSTFNPTTLQQSRIENTTGTLANTMAVIGKTVYCYTATELLALTDGKVSNRYPMANITGIIRSADNQLFIGVRGSYDFENDKEMPAYIIKMNPADGKQIKHELPEGFNVNNFAQTPGITVRGNLVYFSNNTSKIFQHDFDKNETKEMIDAVGNLDYTSPIVYATPAIHPLTGILYINTIKGYGNDYKINDIIGYSFTPNAELKALYKNHTAFPAGIFFIANFK